MTPSRRALLGVAWATGLAATAPARRAETDDVSCLQSLLERYYGFGAKASGGPGDEACRAWLESELSRLGYNCKAQPFEIPFFEIHKATLICGDANVDIIPQAIVTPTGPDGLAAPLRLANGPGDLTGAMAIVVLPYKRWVSLSDPQAYRPIAQAFGRGASAVVAVTTGPSQEAIALNVSPNKPGFEKPVAILAPKDAGSFLAAASQGHPGKLVIDGHGGRRTARNLIARLDRNAEKTLVVSTPRSGWFGCAAERGSGLAVWLFLARWLAQSNIRINIELLAASGHEYEYEGGEHYLKHSPPEPSKTKLWVHIGASAAARDWHEFAPQLLPLPSADSQRFLTATPDVIDPVRHAFKGISGLEAVYFADRVMAGGELTNVLGAGYASAIGLYGSHRYFHTIDDDLKCVSGDLVRPVAEAFRGVLTSLLG